MNEMKFMESIKSGEGQQQHLPGGHCKNNNNNNAPSGLVGVTMEIANKNYSKAMTSHQQHLQQASSSSSTATTSGGSADHVVNNNGGINNSAGKANTVGGTAGSINHTSTSSSPPSSNNVTSCVQECASCGHKIWDRFLLHAMDRYWHTECLKCSCCQAPLGDIGGSCYAKGGMVLCKNDYLRLFGKTGTCTGCGQGIPANEFVMKVQGQHFYHLNCFSCVVCHHRLVSGDRYCVVNDNLLCELDYPKVVKGSIQLPPRMSSRIGV